ncbi:TRAP transporter large permease [Salegentibacter salegens]|uniref:TRAP transporter, DctM subunit n=1 Tax=Salegentibacter salegens TaxID=143223 RepID=A0A1M7IK88_9FLAO|nr:TRAP transporter large permease subunit [Salegentibacter salegens]PRX42501.1 tripartite ATP-independent transporter DctM subunit [Salegentibacter salegens]SHM41028.1 TRAP transporter, DctM subunit [Salegentibacter salegens]
MIIEILILVISFIILLSIGVPVAWSIGISCLAALLVSVDSLATFTTVAQRMATGLDSFSLLAIPFFILAGQIMNQGGIAKRLISFAKALIGSLPGGLIYVNVIASMLFGAISGSAVAAASAIGGILGPHMERENYSKEFGAAINVTSSTTGLIIPPSNVLIVYSMASGGVSIASLFLAGYIPGILMGLALMLMGTVWIRKKKYPAGERSTLKLISTTFLVALPSLLLLIIVIGGIVLGVFTATEASGIAVLYTLILASIYKEINLKKLYNIFLNSIGTTAIVLLLIATSMSMSWVMSFENIPQTVSELLLGLSENKYVILLIINLLLLFVGTFMDITPAVLIFTPIFLPVVENLGVDPVHFGMIMVMNLCVGLCTPPVGSVLFIGVGVAKTSIQKVIKPLLPLYVVMFIVLLMITFIPGISLWLPKLFE